MRRCPDCVRQLAHRRSTASRGRYRGPHREHDGVRYFLYAIIAIGILVSLAGLFLSADSGFSFTIPFLALLATLPYLVLARLASRTSTVETLVAGLLLLFVGAWAYLSEPGTLSTTLHLVLPLYLTALVAAVHIVGRGLRGLITPTGDARNRGRRVGDR